MTVRVIPRLDIKGPNLVKGVHLEGLRVLGKPHEFARYYYDTGADELIFMDAVASLYDRNSLVETIEMTAREIFIPLCVGGGLRTLDDVRRVLRAGADKVSLNTAAIARPELIQEASRAFGASTIVISIEAIKQPDGRYRCFTASGRDDTGLDAKLWAERVAELGAGEILVTSVDQEGTGKGFDLDLTRSIATSVPIPVIAHGGAGRAEDVTAVLKSGQADAVALASIFHYEAVGHIDFDSSNFHGEGNIEFRKGGRPFSKIEPLSIRALKDHMAKSGIEVRRLRHFDVLGPY